MSDAERSAEEALREFQALAGALQHPNGSSVPGGRDMLVDSGHNVSSENVASQLEAIESQLDAFEKRFATADPEVKRLLAEMICQDSQVTHAEVSAYLATPQSSDSVQTQSGTAADARWENSPAQTGQPWECEQAQAMPSPTPLNARAQGHGLTELSPLFPAITPSNSLAQPVSSGDSLSDSAASMPVRIPAMNHKDAILANQLRHRLAGMNEQFPSTIKELLTHAAISDPTHGQASSK